MLYMKPHGNIFFRNATCLERNEDYWEESNGCLNDLIQTLLVGSGEAKTVSGRGEKEKPKGWLTFFPLQQSIYHDMSKKGLFLIKVKLI